MAQTKRKRRSKHRGTAAGMVQARGRTSRPPSETERKKQAREVARAARLDKPPSWSSSAKKAGLAGIVIFVLLYFVVGRSKNASDPLLATIGLALFATAFYVPAGYYMERFMWRRRQEKKAAAR